MRMNFLHSQSISRSNLFDNVIGSDGLAPGFSRSEEGRDESIVISVSNPSNADLQVQVRRSRVGAWVPVEEVISESRDYYVIWYSGFEYRIEQQSAAAIPVDVKLKSDDRCFTPETHATGFKTILGGVGGVNPATGAPLTFDPIPISGSANPVNSGGLFSALAGKANTADIIALTGLINAKVDTADYDETVSVDTFVPATNYTADVHEYGYHVDTTSNIVIDDAVPVGSELSLSSTDGAIVSVYSRPALGDIANAPLVSIENISGATAADGGVQFVDSHIKLRKESATEWKVVESPPVFNAVIPAPTVLSPANGDNITPAAGSATYAYDLTNEPDPVTITLNAATGADGELLRIKAIGASPTKILRVNLPDGLDGDLTAGRFIEINESNDAVTLQRFPGEYRIISSHLARTAAGAPVTPAGPHTHTLADITDSGDAAAADFPAVGGQASATEAVRGDDPRLNATSIVSERHTVAAANLTLGGGGTLQLNSVPIDASRVILLVDNAPTQTNGDDFTVSPSGAVIFSDYLKSLMTAGTEVTFLYTQAGVSSGPVVTPQRTRQNIPLVFGTASYALDSALTADQLEIVNVQATGLPALLFGIDYTVANSILTFNAATASLITTGQTAQVTY